MSSSPEPSRPSHHAQPTDVHATVKLSLALSFGSDLPLSARSHGSRSSKSTGRTPMRTPARQRATRSTPKLTTGIVESIRQFRVARDSAVKARSAALCQLTDLIVTAPDELAIRLSQRKKQAGEGTAQRLREGAREHRRAPGKRRKGSQLDWITTFATAGATSRGTWPRCTPPRPRKLVKWPRGRRQVRPSRLMRPALPLGHGSGCAGPRSGCAQRGGSPGTAVRCRSSSASSEKPPAAPGATSRWKLGCCQRRF